MSPHNTNAAARAIARAAAIEKAAGAYFRLACGHIAHRDQLYTGSRRTRQWVCEVCWTLQPKAKADRRRHPQGRCDPGCARCVADPGELF